MLAERYVNENKKLLLDSMSTNKVIKQEVKGEKVKLESEAIKQEDQTEAILEPS